MFASPGLIFYTVCSVPWLNGNLALAEKCSGPLRFRLRQVLLYKASTVWYFVTEMEYVLLRGTNCVFHM